MEFPTSDLVSRIGIKSGGLLDHSVISPVFNHVNSFPARVEFCRLLTFANSLDPDYDGQYCLL